nr:putative ribonuclease H-like domain-containing protein [Tanacetum cinerariifolium]
MTTLSVGHKNYFVSDLLIDFQIKFSLSIGKIVTHRFTLIVLSALRHSGNENMLSLVILILRSILTDLQETSKGNGGRYEHANPVSLKAQHGGDHMTMNKDYAWLMISRLVLIRFSLVFFLVNFMLLYGLLINQDVVNKDNDKLVKIRPTDAVHKEYLLRVLSTDDNRIEDLLLKNTLSIVYAHTERTILLLNEQDWGSPRHSSMNKIYAKLYLARWGFKRLLSVVKVTAADMEVTTAGSSYNCWLWFLLLAKELILSLDQQVGEYDMRRVRIEQYFQVQDYALWDVIENGNLFISAAQTTTNVDGTLTTLIPGPVTTEEKDAKTLFASIQIRFGGNKATKKTQKTLLKQMYENFSALSTESLDSIFNRLQKIIVEQEVKGTTSSSSSSQNMAFVSSPNNTNEINIANGVSIANTQISPASTQVSTVSTQVSTDNLSDAIVYAFFSSQPNGRKSVWLVSYNVVPPAPTGLFSSPKLDLSNSSLEEFQQPEFDGYGPKTSNSVSEDISNEVKESHDVPLVKELVLDDKLEKKTVFPSVAKIKFVRPKQQEKLVRKPVKYAEMYRPKAVNTVRPNSTVVNAVRENQEKGVIDSGCSRHMTGMSYLSEYKEINGGYVAFGGDHRGGKITGKGNVDTGGLTCLFTKATLDEYNLWHMRLGHINFKTMNKLNGVAKRKNRTLIEAAKTMLANSKLPTTFWAEVVNTACYVQNRILVIKPHNKTLYELFHGKTPILSLMRPFGFPVTILNTLDPLGSGLTWLFDIDTLTKSMNYKPVVAGNQSNGSSGKAIVQTVPDKDYILLPLWTQDLLFSSSFKDSPSDGFIPSGEEEKKDAKYPGNEDNEDLTTKEPRVSQEKDSNVNNTNNINTASPTTNAAGIKHNAVDKDIVYGLYQMDVKSAFLYGMIEEEVYVYQPPGFKDPKFPDRVYKVEKALYGLHQAPRAWYETLSTYLLDNGFHKGQIDNTLFIKKVKGDILLVQVYVDDIIFRSTKKEMCTKFEKIMHKNFQMSSMEELTFFLGLQVTQKDDGIFISQDKYMDQILKKLGFSTMKTASTPMKTLKPLLKEEMLFQVTPKVLHIHDVKRIFRYLKNQPKLGLWYPRDLPFSLEAYTDSDYAGASLDRKSTTGCCQFLGRRLISWQCKKQTVVAKSTTEADTICIVKYPVFHSKTKHIEIGHYFIRDFNEKKLIQMIKLHTDQNVTDFLTKAFDVGRYQYLIASIGMLNL